ncbi:MAG: MFS transporter [Pirellulales bacterium]
MPSPRIPRVVWLLGLVSLCMDLSSEMIHALLPVFLVSTLGASPVTLGIIEGVAEGTASIVKIFSGAISDWVGKRKPLVVLGYGLAAFSKPLFPLANSAGWVLVARFADRIGKGIRGAPRDALVADVTPPETRGAAFGLRQALDTTGALFGPLLAIGLMTVLADNVRAVFWVAALPAVAAVVALAVGVKEPEQHGDGKRRRALPRWGELHTLGRPFWLVVITGTLFTLARFSEAFLIVRAHDVGLSLTWTPLALAVMNITYVISAYPVGILSDRIGRGALLMAGLVTLIAADAVLMFAPGLNLVLVGTALWGLHLGITQGLLSALVADTAPADRRGTAFGLFYFVTGLAAVVSSVMAGALWKWYGPATTFGAGAAFAGVALVLGLWQNRRRRNTLGTPDSGTM